MHGTLDFAVRRIIYLPQTNYAERRSFMDGSGDKAARRKDGYHDHRCSFFWTGAEKEKTGAGLHPVLSLGVQRI